MFIIKIFIKDYENTSDVKVREKYGIVCSIFSIICNIIMVIFKLVFSYITNSVSIRADALNNLSDVGSNIATLFGFKLANKHPDADHPYGHGRIEYMSGLFVSILILFVAFDSIKDSILKIINPNTIKYSTPALIVLIVSIGIKLLMSIVNKQAGNKIDSTSLKAAGQDSFNDCITTLATIISLVFFLITDINIDAYIGTLVSLYVFKEGFEIFKEVLDTILGKAPDKKLIKEIEEFILHEDYILGVHDLVIHDYGPSNKFMSFHAEIDAKSNIIEIHDHIDILEMKILQKFNIASTIHMDPVDIDNKEVELLKNEIIEIVNKLNPSYSIHDFRCVFGQSHTNLVFDLLLPAGDRTDHSELRKYIGSEMLKKHANHFCVIKVEHSLLE